MQRVALTRCGDYEPQDVQNAVDEAVSLLGGWEKYIKPGMKVVVKANLIMRKTPEQCATTHPAVVSAICKSVLRMGATPIIADSPGGPFVHPVLKNAYETCGMVQAAKDSGATLNFETGFREVLLSEGKKLHEASICDYILDADVVISAAKLKTHGMTGYTGAVKNLYGTVPGTVKVEYHYRLPEIDDFSQMIVDIAGFVKPVLSIIDGVYGMEGNGPTGGTPRKIGAIIASACPHSADVVGITLINQKPLDICTIARAVERGILSGQIKDIEVAGCAYEELVVADYKSAQKRDLHVADRYVPSFARETVRKMLRSKPMLVSDLCVGCRDCMKNCPPKAIVMVKNRPKIDRKKCIRCFCCQELCPTTAMKIKSPLLLRVIK